jgi:hypothetical protein
LLVDRRNRDIISAHASNKKPAAAAPNMSDSKPATAAPDSRTSLGLPGHDDELARSSGTVKPGAVKQIGETKKSAGKPFVDRQLEMAVKYLREELAKK